MESTTFWKSIRIQSCSVSKETFDLRVTGLVEQSIKILALLNKLLDKSVPLVTVRSFVSLLTEQLCNCNCICIYCFSRKIYFTHSNMLCYKYLLRWKEKRLWFFRNDFNLFCYSRTTHNNVSKLLNVTWIKIWHIVWTIWPRFKVSA